MKRPGKITIWKAIRQFCLECMGKSSNEVNNCSATRCQLYPLRLGPGAPVWDIDENRAEIGRKNLANAHRIGEKNRKATVFSPG